ncbi:immunoglobulin domain protein [Onchocerca flexuosa]|uniref:Immunoglobulin domain protein n=1 Tax=Onchocerca flexuosa TaxID=387005 RepID=A0A238BP65_9BILA|nr:immunoglobulin domain protein [Onchocerca flexuosa]
MLLLRLFLIVRIANFACGRQSIPAFIEPAMENVTAVKGQDVEFKCQVSKLGKHMVAFARADMPPRLIAFDERENDVGGYSCQLNTDPVISRTGYLRIKGNLWLNEAMPPYVARTTASAVEVREGQNVTLSCRAFGDPPPTIVWRRLDRQIIRFNGATGYGASVFNGSDLTIIKVNRKHMSDYICVASNGVPPDESWSVKLHVTFEPVVVPQAEIVQVALGGQISLVCNAEAWPRPLVKWEKNGKQIFDSPTFSLKKLGQVISSKVNSSGYMDDDSDDDDDDDNDDENKTADYSDNRSITSPFELQNSSNSARKLEETFQIQTKSGRLLSSHSSQSSSHRKGVHVNDNSDYNDCYDMTVTKSQEHKLRRLEKIGGEICYGNRTVLLNWFTIS